MQQSNAPAKLVLPFANSGGKNTIPTASQVGITPGAASLTDGFPPLTRTPLVGGGVPPSGLDMNGILFELSAITRWMNAGAGYYYDSTFANDVNVVGYPKGATVLRTDATGYWLNTVDNNVTDPEAGGAGWVPYYQDGLTSVTMTSANVTLTALQAGRSIIVISGLLTANLNLILPTYIKNWLIVNNTTGAFSITAKTAAGTGVVIAQGQASYIYGDGVNVSYSGNDSLKRIASAGGTADVITATFSKVPTAFVNGLPYYVRAASANATTTPTFTPNSGTLAAKTIVKGNNLALAVGDIAGAGHWLELQYDSTLDKWVLLNPAKGVIVTPAASETVPGISEIATQVETDAITDDTRMVTPLKLGFGFAFLNATTGYIKFPSWLMGFIIQWGQATSNVSANAVTAVNFPLVFPNAVRQIFVSPQVNSATPGDARYHDPTTSGFNMRSSYTSATISYIAVGK